MPRNKKPQTLDDIFANDPIETTGKKCDNIWKEIKRAHPQERAIQEKILKILNAVYDEPGKPEIAKRLKELGAWGKDWRKNQNEIAASLEIEVSDLETYKRINALGAEIIRKRIIGPHKTAWKRLVKTAPITVLEGGSFPNNTNRPFIIFFSADWCGPCQMTKPAFALLARFFDKAKLYFYSSDTIFEEHPELEFVPQLVAYLPNGARVHSSCGKNAQELWKNMNLLITLGQSFEGNGELACSENECHIEPKREA